MQLCTFTVWLHFPLSAAFFALCDSSLLQLHVCFLYHLPPNHQLRKEVSCWQVKYYATAWLFVMKLQRSWGHRSEWLPLSMTPLKSLLGFKEWMTPIDHSLFQPQSGCPGYNHERFMWGFFWYRDLIAQGNQRASCSGHLTTTILLIVTTTMWGNHLLALKTWKFLTATLKCICKDSLSDLLRVLSVLWCKMDWARLLTH